MGARIFHSVLACLALASSACACAGDRLTGTGGAHMVEGAAGGGLVPWALIAGYGTNRQVGGSVFYTHVKTGDFDLESYGAAAGFFDRVELSYARQKFDAGSVVPGLTLRMDTVGAKVRLFGDAVYDQDSPWPQVAVGALHKRNLDMAIPAAIGARRGSDTDLYVAATKVWLAGFLGRNVVGDITLRETRANQFGLLGFGGDRGASRSLQPEASIALMLADNLVLGAELRGKPDNLSAFREQNAGDVFLAWFAHRNLAITAAYASLGAIAGKSRQQGPYLSLQFTL